MYSKIPKRKSVLILVNDFLTIEKFRMETVIGLIENGYHVTVALPESQKSSILEEMGCSVVFTAMDRRGANPVQEINLFFRYLSLLNKIKPSILLTFTIKPNLYGGIASRIFRTPVIHTITGIGTVFLMKKWYKSLIVFLYRISFKKAERMIFLNEENKLMFTKLLISDPKRSLVIPGSGVNMDHFKYSPLIEDEIVKFSYFGRIIKDKGIIELLEAAQIIKKSGLKANFSIYGLIDDSIFKKTIQHFSNLGVIEYKGVSNDVPKDMKSSECILLPSYGEGRGTVLQEASAIGRPIITTNVMGCKDNVDHGINGYLCNVRDSNDLACKLADYCSLSFQKRQMMGEMGRLKAVREYDRKKIVDTYILEVGSIIK